VKGLDAQFARHHRAWQEEQARAAEAALMAGARQAPADRAGAPAGKPDGTTG